MLRKIKRLKDETGSKLTIGTQFILLPENKDYVISQARTMKEIGATLDLSESRVSQIHSSILVRLKDQLADRKRELHV